MIAGSVGMGNGVLKTRQTKAQKRALEQKTGK